MAVFHNPAFQEGIGQVELDGGYQLVNHLVEEDGVGLGCKLLLHFALDGLLEGIKVFDVVLGEDLLEELFVQFRLLVADGIINDDVEVGSGGGVLSQNLGCFFFRTEHLGEVDNEL